MDLKSGKSFSWSVIDNDTIIKNGDKSFFEYNDSGIPKDIKWFFDAKSMVHGDAKEIVLTYLKRDYTGRIYIDPMQRCRLTWGATLGEELKKCYVVTDGEYPMIRFHRYETDKYTIEFIDENVVINEEEEPYETKITSKEGRKTQYYVSKYERSPEVRKKAILIHGTKCMICGFDFEAFYGEAGKNFIEVHHLKPLSEVGEEVEIDPSTDVICVCSNCHRIIHRKKGGIFSPQEVRNMIRENERGEGEVRNELLKDLKKTRFNVLWPEDEWEDLGFTEHPIWVNGKGYGYFMCDEPNIFYKAAKIPDEKWKQIRERVKDGSLIWKDIGETSLAKMVFFEDEETFSINDIKRILSLPEQMDNYYYCGQTIEGETVFFSTEKEFLDYFGRDYADYKWEELDDNLLIEWHNRLQNSEYGSGYNFFEIIE